MGAWENPPPRHPEVRKEWGDATSISELVSFQAPKQGYQRTSVSEIGGTVEARGAYADGTFTQPFDRGFVSFTRKGSQHHQSPAAYSKSKIRE